MISNKNIVAIEYKCNDIESWSDFVVRDLLRAMKPQIEEVFILGTCQRLFICAYASNVDELKKLSSSLSIKNLDKSLVDTESTVRYLFEIASGIHSRVIGEYEILGQINKYFELAQSEKCIGPHLNELIREAITTGKKVRLSTSISRNNVSYASLGLKLIKEKFGTYNLNYLVVGTGALAQKVVRVLQKQGVESLYVASHDLSRARRFTEFHFGVPVLIDNVQSVSGKFDVIIGGTHGAVSYTNIFDSSDQCPRHDLFIQGRSKLIIDYGSPANFPNGKNFIGSYYSLSDLTGMVEINILNRKLETLPAIKLIKKSVAKFISIHQQRKVSGILGGFWNKLSESQDEELNWLLPKLENLSPKDHKLIERFSHRLIRKIAKNPLSNIRQLAKNLPDNTEKISVINNAINSKK